jgi:hypothetical protein
MTTYSLTLRDDHEAQLRGHLLRGDGCEHSVVPLAHILKNRQTRLSGAFACENSVPRSSTYRSDRLGLIHSKAQIKQSPRRSNASDSPIRC